MSITRPTKHEARLRNYGLARAQPVRELTRNTKGLDWQPNGEVELFITGFTYYLTADEARAFARLLESAADEADSP